MSDNNETAVAVRTPDVSMAEFGSREDVRALGRRVKSLMPGGNKLSDEHAMAVAQYALALGLNPFHDLYAFEKGGQLHIVEHYRALVGWAKSKCDYSEWFVPLPDRPAGEVGFTCYILRNDKQDLLDTLLTRGMDLDRALGIVATTAGGVARTGDSIPTGWTLEDVAQKRALKNALNKSHGAPSPAEIAAQSWQVNGHETTADDWRNVTPEMIPNEAESVAAYSATLRRVQETHPENGDANEAIAELFGDDAIEDAVTEEMPTDYDGNGALEYEPEPATDYIRVPYPGGLSGQEMLVHAVLVMPFKNLGECMTVLAQMLGPDWRKAEPAAQWETLDTHCASATVQAEMPLEVPA